MQKRGVGPDSFWQAAETAEDTKVIDLTPAVKIFADVCVHASL